MPGDSDFAWPAGVSAPARRALASAGYTELRQLHDVSVSELKKLHGMGPKAIDILQQALAAQGMSLAS